MTARDLIRLLMQVHPETPVVLGSDHNDAYECQGAMITSMYKHNHYWVHPENMQYISATNPNCRLQVVVNIDATNM